MRFVSFLVLLIGAAIGFGYPWALEHLSGHQIGKARVYEAVGGFKPFEARLATSDAPVKIVLDMTGIIPQPVAADETLFTIVATHDDKTVLTATVDAVHARRQGDSPQTLQQIYRLEAGSLSDISDGVYRFTVGPGDADGVDLVSVDLSLLGGIGGYDPRAQPVGLCVMAVGFIGLAISLRRRRGPAGPGAPPSGPRWGRGPTQP